MDVYTLEVTKTLLLQVYAESAADAMEVAVVNSEKGFYDDGWAIVESVAKVVNEPSEEFSY
jgi:hypothetical protein